MRRSLVLLATAATLATAFAAPTAAALAAVSCTAAASATYRHSFDGPSGKATITSVRPLCPGQTQSFALASYTAGAPSGSNAGQFVYATDRATITATDHSVTLKVAVPPCYAQVDAITGTDVLDEATSPGNPYGAKTLGTFASRSSGAQAHYRGGDGDCTPAPKVTFASACNGSFTASLANGANANVGATFRANGRLTRVGPGRATTIKGPARGTLTIRDNTFTTYVGSWRAPAAGCAPAAVTKAPVAARSSAPAAAAAVPPAPAASTSAGVTTTGSANAPAAMYFPPPPAVTARAKSAVATGGMSVGSAVAIGFGLLLMGGGVVLLTRVIRTLREPA